MRENSYRRIGKFTAYAAVLFWVLCWIIPEQDKLIKIIGIGLPWFSVLVSMPIMWILDIESKREASFVAYSYIICTVLYVVIVSLLRMSYINQVPHLACCVSVIAAVALYNIQQDEKKMFDALRRRLDMIRHQHVAPEQIEELRRIINND